jgi:hypothetical protein
MGVPISEIILSPLLRPAQRLGSSYKLHLGTLATNTFENFVSVRKKVVKK